MNCVSTDHGTMLPADAAALIVDVSGELSILLPNYPDAAEVPRMVQLLVAVAIRSKDEEWIDDVLTVLESAS